MTPEELRQCLDEAFGDLEPPYLEEVCESADIDGFEAAARTDTGRAKRWQELRPLSQYQTHGSAIFILTPRAWQYYLPAYLYAMTDAKVLWCYLSPILDTLWYQNEDGDYLGYEARWVRRTAPLTDRQRRCIAHFLLELLRAIDDPSVDLGAEVDWERDRIEHMLEKYWNAWL
jgi:hypothetical protein